MKFLTGLFSKPAEPVVLELSLQPPAPTQTVNVVGDVHGRADLLARMLDKRDRDGQLVFVGDYVDRGDDSQQVLEMLFAHQTEAAEQTTCLMGNHERMMLDFLDNPVEKGARWLRNGGLQTLASFRIGEVSEGATAGAMETARNRLRAAMPEEMENWLRELPLSWSSGNLWVVHAAADPSVPLHDQEARTLLWGKELFLRTPRTDGIWVAHGHTVVAQPEFRQSRVATDTGAYYTGRLTCAAIRPDGQVTFSAA